MNAPKMSQTVVFEKPDRPHLIASAGLGSTRPRTVASATPVTPTAAAGIGSRTRPTTTAQNSAKKYHAMGFRPDGTGSTAMITPTRMAITPFQISRCAWKSRWRTEDGSLRAGPSSFIRTLPFTTSDPSPRCALMQVTQWRKLGADRMLPPQDERRREEAPSGMKREDLAPDLLHELRAGVHGQARCGNRMSDARAHGAAPHDHPLRPEDGAGARDADGHDRHARFQRREETRLLEWAEGAVARARALREDEDGHPPRKATIQPRKDVPRLIL